jgi:hypothetical protein
VARFALEGYRIVSELVVATGHILALRLYDVAFAIDLASAERLWAAHAFGTSARAQLSGTPPKAMNFGVPPLALGIGSVTLTLEGGPIEAAATARLYDFGVVSLALRVEADGRDVTNFARLMNVIQVTIGPGSGSGQWASMLARLRSVLAAALVRPNPAIVEEDYLLGVVPRAFRGRAQRPAAPAILLL